MERTVTTGLAPEELQSLRDLSRAHPVLLNELRHTENLLADGFATENTDGTGITQLGFAKLVYETTRAAWFPAK